MSLDRRFYTEREAAAWLGYQYNSLRDARLTGKKLGGTTPPRHVAFGKSIRYDIADLEAWVNQFIGEKSA